MPHAYVGKKVRVKATDKVVQIYYQEILIKQHVITDHYHYTDFNDFPDDVQAALDEGVPLNLQRRTEAVGDDFAKLIRTVLEPYAFMNMRKAQGLLSLAQKYDNRLCRSNLWTLFVRQIILFTKNKEKIIAQTARLKTQLKTLKLSGILDNFDLRLLEARQNQLAYSEFLSIILSDEIETRNMRKLKRLLM